MTPPLRCPYCGEALKIERSQRTGLFSAWCPHNCDRDATHCFYLGGYPTMGEIRERVQRARARGAAA